MKSIRFFVEGLLWISYLLIHDLLMHLKQKIISEHKDGYIVPYGFSYGRNAYICLRLPLPFVYRGRSLRCMKDDQWQMVNLFIVWAISDELIGFYKSSFGRFNFELIDIDIDAGMFKPVIYRTLDGHGEEREIYSAGDA